MPDLPEDWRIDGWEYGEEGEPYLTIETRAGSRYTLMLSDLYPEYDDGEFCAWDDLPEPWRQLIEESCIEVEAEIVAGSAGGEFVYEGEYAWDRGKSPCRWRPEAELQNLRAHAEACLLDGSPRHVGRVV